MAAFKSDLGAEIADQKDSPVNYGSEFRDTTALEKLFLHHEDKTKEHNQARVSLPSRSNWRGKNKIRPKRYYTKEKP